MSSRESKLGPLCPFRSSAAYAKPYAPFTCLLKGLVSSKECFDIRGDKQEGLAATVDHLTSSACLRLPHGTVPLAATHTALRFGSKSIFPALIVCLTAANKLPFSWRGSHDGSHPCCKWAETKYIDQEHLPGRHLLTSTQSILLLLSVLVPKQPIPHDQNMWLNPKLKVYRQHQYLKLSTKTSFSNQPSLSIRRHFPTSSP
ncbi:hypothetical protein AC579_6809 [Pseudocercospora musae]|uniref:Uncharacterized protein n=1 Tax=Pseudocercospora musae TaxID=113226 RepID=A0A139IQN1_9PEZI|nr:hypothetical protein AC579_6809 [Pseudocercospora musae]